MRIEQKVVETKDIYISNDGKEFTTEVACLGYEEYYPKTIYEVIKDYVVASEKTLEAFKRNEIPANVFIIVLKEIPSKIRAYVELIEKDQCNKSGIPYNFHNDDYPCLFYNKWDFYSQGWSRIGTERDFQNSIDMFKIYKNLMKED